MKYYHCIIIRYPPFKQTINIIRNNIDRYMNRIYIIENRLSMADLYRYYEFEILFIIPIRYFFFLLLLEVILNQQDYL